MRLDQARVRIGLEEAFELIRRAARTNRMKLHDLVHLIGPGTETPPELATVISQRESVRHCSGGGGSIE